MSNNSILDLTFPKISYGRRTIPIDLKVLLYKCRPGENYRTVLTKISGVELIEPLGERIELVQLIHSEMSALLASGRSQVTHKGVFNTFRRFFEWIDSQNIEPSIKSIETLYRQWADYLYGRTLRSEIIMKTAYSMGIYVSVVLSAILETPKPLIKTTRLVEDKSRKITTSSEQNLSDIFKFGHLLIDVVSCLNIKAVYGTLPIKMKLRNGLAWSEWSGLQKLDNLKTYLDANTKTSQKKSSLARRAAWEMDHSIRRRHSPINLRLSAELLIFIAQTGMNLTQARQLKMTQANYTSSIDGYRVRAYKNRKGGEVAFEIFSQYRSHFEQYLAWRKSIFKDTSELLFPFVYCDGSPTPAKTPLTLNKIKAICKMATIKYICPKELRKTRINWLLRQSRNPDLIADQAQHSKEVLHRYYEQPSLQIAKIEFIQFWNKNDPSLQQNKVAFAPAPGVCDGIPAPIKHISPDAPIPDCIHPSGCLFCNHHRDIDSEDFIWSIASMKCLNANIISKYRPIEKHKTNTSRHIEMVLAVLVAKLKWFESSNEKRKKWVEESLARCSEGDFHPHWSYLIESVGV